MRISDWSSDVCSSDLDKGEQLILLHHTSHDVATPYRSAYAIYVRELAQEPADYIDKLPPVFEGRPLGMRGFGEDGLLKDARLALPGQEVGGESWRARGWM